MGVKITSLTKRECYKRKYNARKKAGVCVRCGGPLNTQLTCCKKCNDKTKENIKKRKDKQKHFFTLNEKESEKFLEKMRVEERRKINAKDKQICGEVKKFIKGKHTWI